MGAARIFPSNINFKPSPKLFWNASLSDTYPPKSTSWFWNGPIFVSRASAGASLPLIMFLILLSRSAYGTSISSILIFGCSSIYLSASFMKDSPSFPSLNQTTSNVFTSFSAFLPPPEQPESVPNTIAPASRTDNHFFIRSSPLLLIRLFYQLFCTINHR